MRFRATVELGGATATGVHVPDEVVASLGAGKRPKVRVKINGYTYRSSVASMGGRFMLGISADVRERAGVAAGDQVDVYLELDTDPREVTVPADFAKALATDAHARRSSKGCRTAASSGTCSRSRRPRPRRRGQRRIGKAIAELREGQGMKRSRRSDGTTIAFDRSGEGPPLVVVGGALSVRSAIGRRPSRWPPSSRCSPTTGGAAATAATPAVRRRARGRGPPRPSSPGPADRRSCSAIPRVQRSRSRRPTHGLPVTKLALYEPPFIVDDGPNRSRTTTSRTARRDAAVRTAGATRSSTSSRTGPGVPPEVIAGMREEPSWSAMEKRRTPSRTTAG